MLDFLKTQRVGVIAVEMPDGSPHGATVHFAHTEDPFRFIFLTDPESRKHEPLAGKKTVRATFVIGASEETMKSLQMDGEAQLMDTPEVRDAYLSTFPGKIEKFAHNVLFTFSPIWWRYTDWKTPEGKKIWTS